MNMEDIKRVAVVGAGLMGHGIAQVFAQSGYQVKMHDIREEFVKSAYQRIRANLQALEEKDLIDKKEVERTLTRIEGTTDIVEAVKNADFVIEAVTEVLSVKKEVFRNLDEKCPEHTILATNTSGFSITEISSMTKRPQKVIGTHYWNPPHLMQAVEIVRGAKTSDETSEVTRRLLINVGKKPVVISKDIPGQIGIRILYAMLREAISLVDKRVATAEDIDTVVKEALGTRLSVIGLLEMADLSGLDLVLAVSTQLNKDLDRSTEPSSLVKEKVKKGELGIRTGKGFHDWTGKNIASVINKRDDHLIEILREKRQST